MHLRTHVRAEHRGHYQHGNSEYVDGMIEHDDTIGSLLKALDDMGIANNTIVVYTSDNGPHMNTWPDGAMTWFRSEKNTNWEGAFRVPCLVRWPRVIQPGTVTNELMSDNDWIPTLRAVAGEPDIVNKLRQVYLANGINYKVHLDGYSQLEFLRSVSGSAANNNGVKSARDTFFTPMMTACSLACGRAIGSTFSPNSERKGRWPCGRSPSRRCACRRSTTCSRTPSNAPTSRPIRIGIG
jgi:arylsulfatase